MHTFSIIVIENYKYIIGFSIKRLNITYHMVSVFGKKRKKKFVLKKLSENNSLFFNAAVTCTGNTYPTRAAKALTKTLHATLGRSLNWKNITDQT